MTKRKKLNLSKVGEGDYTFWRNDETNKYAISMADAIKLLQKEGGVAFTCYCDYSGEIAVMAQIVLYGKNKSKVRLEEV